MAVIDHERWRALGPLLDRALDMPTDARGAWLAELRAGSPELAAELDALLASEAAADRSGFLAAPLVTHLVPNGEPLVGLRLGAWTLERAIGYGGMGSVWLARRADGRFEGVAAVKFLNLALLTRAGQARFRREGSVLARLTHPNITRLFDAGVSDAGQPYLVLEHVDGQPIDVYAAEQALSTDDRVRLVLQVLDAVGHAHANLIVHRDLKPSNILVRQDGTVKLLDFGIAKLLDEEGVDGRSALTQDGGRALTPEYASPEQVRGDPVTTATDVYALGVLLYRLVSGRHPTAEGSRTPAETIRVLFEVDPARLGLGDLDTVLAKALRKDVAERYQTVAAFADDLTRYLDHEPVTARGQSLAYRTRKFVRRNRVAVTAGAIVAASLIAATAFSVRQAGEARTQRDAAVQSAKRALAFNSVQTVLAGDSRGPDGRPLDAMERVALAERVLTRRFGSEPWLVAELMADLSDRYYEAGDRVAQRHMLARARAIARRAQSPVEIAFADCRRVQSFAYDDMIDSGRIDLVEAKRALVHPEVRSDAGIVAACLSAEGSLLVAAGQPDSGIRAMQAAVPFADSSIDALNRLSILNDLGEQLRLVGRQREGVPYQRRVVASLDSLGYGATELLPNAATFVAGSLTELGEFEAVVDLLRPFVREQEAAYGAGQVSTVLAVLYGTALLRLEARDSADVWIARAMRDTTAGAGATVRSLPAALTQLRLEQGRIAEARQTAATLLTPARGMRATAAWLRARVAVASGVSPTIAAATLERELHTVTTDGKRPLTAFALPLIQAGEWRLARGDARGADSLALLARRMASPDTLALVRSAYVGRAELLRAHARIALGDSAGAREAARRAEVALGVGYGAQHARTIAARALLDSLAR